MDITADRRIAAPRARLWTALHSADGLRGLLPGCRSLEETGPGAFRALIDAAVLTTVSWRVIDEAPETALRLEGRIEGARTAVFTGHARFADEGVFTRVMVEASGEAVASQEAVDRLLDHAAATLAGPEKRGADGAAALVETLTEPAAAPPGLLAMLPREPLGLPRFAWVCVAIFLFIVFNLFEPYL